MNSSTSLTSGSSNVDSRKKQEHGVEEDLVLKRVQKKRVFVDRLHVAIKYLEWKESCVQMRRRSRLNLSKNITSATSVTSKKTEDKLTERRFTLELFDEFCRLYISLFFLREPNIQNVNNFKKVLKSHIVIEDERSLMKETLWVCYEDYFEDWFMSKNDALQRKEKGDKAQRGWYLFKHYRNTRNELFLEWEKIFWRPSFTVTANFMAAMDPFLSKERACCPSVLRKFGDEEIPQCFGIRGRVCEKIAGVSKPTLSLDLSFCKLNPPNEAEEIVSYNPFNAFVKFIFDDLLEILQLLNQINQKIIHSTSSSLNMDGFPEIKPPKENECTIEGLIKFGDFQFTFDLICGYISSLIDLSSKSDNELDNNIKNDISKLHDLFLDFRQSVESHEMHAFMAMWTFWDRPGQPYLVNFLMRATNLKQFHMLLSEDLLGTFLMVRIFCK